MTNKLKALLATLALSTAVLTGCNGDSEKEAYQATPITEEARSEAEAASLSPTEERLNNMTDEEIEAEKEAKEVEIVTEPKEPTNEEERRANMTEAERLAEDEERAQAEADQAYLAEKARVETEASEDEAVEILSDAMDDFYWAVAGWSERTDRVFTGGDVGWNGAYFTVTVGVDETVWDTSTGDAKLSIARSIEDAVEEALITEESVLIEIQSSIREIVAERDRTSGDWLILR